MSKCKSIIVSISLLLGLLLMLLPSLAFGAETQYPQGVAAAKDSTVEVTAWIDGTVSGGGRSFEARGPVQLGSGFFANEDGDVFTAAHVVSMSDEQLAEAAIMYYIGGIWFEDKWYEDIDFGSFYNYYYGSTWWMWVNDELTVTAAEADYVYRYGDEESHMVQNIRFREAPESGMDIAILETGLSNTPYIGLREDVPPEGTQAYVIGYAGIDLIDIEFWQAMDTIMKDPRERPDSFSELMREAEERMVEGLRREGPSIETGLLGSSTRIYDMDARRFYGTTWGGFSGGPVVDELGNCLGLLPWGEGGRGWFIPAEHLNDASQQAGINTFPALEIGSVTVEPSFVEAGQSFEVRTEVSNLGFVQGDYTATLTLEDGTEASQELTLAEGATETLVLSAVKKSSGLSSGSLEIGRTSVDVVVNPIEISNLTVKPVQVAPGEDVRVEAEARNLSDERSTCVISLSIDGGEEATRTLTLESGAAETVTFVVTRDIAGTYLAAIGNLTQQFTVKSELPWTLIGLAAAGLLGLVGIVLGALALIRFRG